MPPPSFAAPFWIGMFWRRATRIAAWITIVFVLAFFFLAPIFLPVVNPALATNASFLQTNDKTTTVVQRPAAPSDVAKRDAAIKNWGNEEKDKRGDRPVPIQVGEVIDDVYTRGGTSVFWAGGLQKLGDDGQPSPLDDDDWEPVGDAQVLEESEDRKVVETRRRLKAGLNLQGAGFFNASFVFYQLIGMDFAAREDSMLQTLRLPPMVFTPLLLMVLLSLLTPRTSPEALDRYYVKMKTPVDPNPEEDVRQLEESYANPTRFDHKKLFPGTSLEILRPNATDIIGFVLSVAACFLIIALAVWVTQIGAAP